MKDKREGSEGRGSSREQKGREMGRGKERERESKFIM